jgi:hypothetical protein
LVTADRHLFEHTHTLQRVWHLSQVGSF